MSVEKNQNPGGRFGANSQTTMPILPIWLIFAVNGLDWQCCLAGSSKRAPRILIFFNCHGCSIFILCEIHCYFCPHILWVYYFRLSQCDLRSIITNAKIPKNQRNIQLLKAIVMTSKDFEGGETNIKHAVASSYTQGSYFGYGFLSLCRLKEINEF